MVRLFPGLGTARISLSRMGHVGFTFETLAHTGARERIHHAMGYCGSGIGMAFYLCMKAGLRVLGDGQRQAALMSPRFPAHPLYRGDPRFLSGAVTAYRMLDRVEL